MALLQDMGCHSQDMDYKQLELLLTARSLSASGEARLRRELAGLSMSETAAVIGTDISTIWRWEHGQRRPRGAPAIRYGQLLQKLPPSPVKTNQVPA